MVPKIDRGGRAIALCKRAVAHADAGISIPAGHPIMDDMRALFEDAPEPAVCPVSAMQCAFARVVVECKEPDVQCPHRVESKICH